jgi:hypothetical protein
MRLLLNSLWLASAVVYSAGALASKVSSGNTVGCGVAPIESILNPNKQLEPARPFSWPWVVTPDNFGSILGTVLGSRWVLTSELGARGVHTGVYSYVYNQPVYP